MDARLTRRDEIRRRHPRAGGRPDQSVGSWIPAFAGMTVAGRGGSLTVDCELIYGGEGGIPTHVPAFGRKDAFKAPRVGNYP